MSKMLKRMFLSAIVLVAVRTFAIGAVPPGDLRFAFITDLHIAIGANSVNDLSACIRDINSQDSLAFTMVGGDLTDFGTDEEIHLVKKMLDSLRTPYYVVQGNHDANWSESGCNTFKNVFGYEHFDFRYAGWRFLGCNCGPDMRMAPGLVPRETMKWLEALEPDGPAIFINHYPQDSSVLNYFDVTRNMKRLDVRFCIGGHWHRNTILNYNGLPGVLCRSSLSAGKRPGYTIVEIKDGVITFSEKRIYGSTAVKLPAWRTCKLEHVADTVTYDAHGLPSDYPWVRYDVNDRYPAVHEAWKVAFDANIAAGFAVQGKTAFFPLASGEVKAISVESGKVLWSKQLPGKIYSTPAVSGKTVVIGCSDGYVYALKATNGNILWKYKCRKSVLACPKIHNGKVYIGASDGCFRALSLKDGSPVWTYTGVQGHAISTPYIDDSQVVFGTWGRNLYSLDPETGHEQWVWTVGKASRMLSPASCVPVKSAGRIFVAVPDRNIYAIDASTGEGLFRVEGGRDALCLSEDGSMVFSKTMFNRAYAFPAAVQAKGVMSPDLKIWDKADSTGYEIAPTVLREHAGVLYIPTDKGNLIALSSATGDFLWEHKISVALVNPIYVLERGGNLCILASCMDGTVVRLDVRQ